MPAEISPRQSQMREATLSPEQKARVGQAILLREGRIRALWPHLKPNQQELVLNPSDEPRSYPLTAGQVAALASLTKRQVRYWADGGLIPHWHKGSRRQFEAVGLVMAFSIANAGQHEIQFYRNLMEEPVGSVSVKLAIVSSLLASRIDDASPGEAEVLKKLLAALPQP